MPGRAGIETLLYLLDEAFRGPGIEQSNESQALLPNLRIVDAVDCAIVLGEAVGTA